VDFRRRRDGPKIRLAFHNDNILNLRPSRKKPEMNTDTHALTIDMLRFSALLHSMNIAGLDRSYATKAMELQSDPSDQNVEDVREWVRLTLKGGSGGLGDRYVHNPDGTVNESLNTQYEELLQNLTDFANGKAVVQKSADAMWDRDSAYFRKVTASVRKGWFSSTGSTTYEVMTAPGVTRIVGVDQLAEAVGYGASHSRKDWHECQMVADRLYREGRKDDWVHYSSSYIVPDESLRKIG
jgi:hypothetical protein